MAESKTKKLIGSHIVGGRKFRVDAEAGKKVVAIARGYIGQKEISGNQGFVNPTFNRKMYGVGFIKGQPWCGWFGKLSWKEGGLFFPMIVPGSAMLIEMSLNPELKPFWVNKPEDILPGSMAVFARYKNGVRKSNGHIAVVEKCEDGMLHTVDGNTTGDKQSREGNVVDDKSFDLKSAWTRNNGLRLMGIYLPIVEDHGEK